MDGAHNDIVHLSGAEFGAGAVERRPMLKLGMRRAQKVLRCLGVVPQQIAQCDYTGASFINRGHVGPLLIPS
jgi:hypothetical protein